MTVINVVVAACIPWSVNTLALAAETTALDTSAANFSIAIATNQDDGRKITIPTSGLQSIVSSLPSTAPLRALASSSLFVLKSPNTPDFWRAVSCKIEIEINDTDGHSQSLGEVPLTIELQNKPIDAGFPDRVLMRLSGTGSLSPFGSEFSDKRASIEARLLCNGSRVMEAIGETRTNTPVLLTGAAIIGSVPKFTSGSPRIVETGQGTYYGYIDPSDWVGHGGLDNSNMGFAYVFAICSKPVGASEPSLPTSCAPLASGVSSGVTFVTKEISFSKSDRKRFLTILFHIQNKYGELDITSSSISLAQWPSSSGTAKAALRQFSNCTSLNRVFSGGIRKSSVTYNRGGSISKLAFVSPKGYQLNQKLDRDKDGIACER